MGSVRGDFTKRLLTQSLKKLMSEKPLEKISIREITEDSGLNRQTFYYHFSDIYDQLQWMYKDEAVKLFEQYEGENLWQEGLLNFFNYVKDNKDVWDCLLKSPWRDRLIGLFYDDIHDIVKHTVSTFADRLGANDKYKEMLTQYYVISFGSMIENWVYGYVKESPEELVEFFDTIIQDQMKGTAMRYRNGDK